MEEITFGAPPQVPQFDKPKASKKKEVKQEEKSMADYISDLQDDDSDDEAMSEIRFFYPFNCTPLDINFGGGVPSGRIIEVFGYESNGKTSLALEMTKAFTSYWSNTDEKYAVLWVESEMSIDKVRAAYMGVDIKKFIVREAETVEDAQERMVDYIQRASQKGIKLFIVWDTLGSAPTRNEYINSQGLSKNKYAGGMAEKPRIVWTMLRTLKTMLAKTDTSLILINPAQPDMEGGFIPKTPGGNGPKFFSSIRTWVRKTSERMLTTLPSGVEIERAVVVDVYNYKNKVTLPRQTTKIILDNERGLDRADTMMKYLFINGYIKVAGSWKTITMPESYAQNGLEGSKIPAPMMDFTYQNKTKFEEALNGGIPHFRDWVDYLIYVKSTEVSPLLKVRLAEKIWNYELKFFGEKRMILTDEEHRLADMVSQEIKHQ